MNKIWLGVVALAALMIVFAPSSEPALPEPGARRVVAAVFGDTE